MPRYTHAFVNQTEVIMKAHHFQGWNSDLLDAPEKVAFRRALFCTGGSHAPFETGWHRTFVFALIAFGAFSFIAKGEAAPSAASSESAVADVQRIEQLTVEIRQRDSAERRVKALSDLRAMLDADAGSQAAALAALARAADIKFERDGLEPKVAALLSSPSAEVRRAALMALPTLNPGAERVEEIAKLAKDPDPRVRAAVMPSIMTVRHAARIGAAVDEPALSLLGDGDDNVVVETARSLWGVPVSKEVERKAIDLSRFEAGKIPDSKSVPYRMNYFVLSTRPRVSREVAERLAEIARHPVLGQDWTGRAVWGLAHGCAPEAVDVVTKALIEELDNSLIPYNREWAVRGLAGVQTEAAKKKLAEVAAKDDSEELRRLAANALPRRPA
jgi:hypothetical protein